MFVRFPHIERIESEGFEGLTGGRCYIFPELDGVHMSVYTEDGETVCVSERGPMEEGGAFYRYVTENGGIGRLLKDRPGIRLFGIWMEPRTALGYRDDVWYRWFVSDVCEEQCGKTVRFLPYTEYSELLDEYQIEYIRPLAVINGPSVEELQGIADTRNRAYMADGKGCGKGVMIKNYGFTDAEGDAVWGEVPNSAYSDKAEDTSIERAIAERVVTTEMVDAEYQRIMESDGTAGPSELLDAVWNRMMKEHLWEEMERYGDPVIDFGRLRIETVRLVKDAKPDVFEDRDMIEGQES